MRPCGGQFIGQGGGQRLAQVDAGDFGADARFQASDVQGPAGVLSWVAQPTPGEGRV